jgi:Chaperone of endosialidase
VTVNLTTGLLGHLVSSRRYKEEIKPMDKASEALYRLNPVTYRYKKEIDPTQSPAFGLIAEEVAQVNPELVACNAAGQPESVHYEMVNAMLLNEFLKEHRKVEEQQAAIAQLKSVVAQQQKEFQAAIAEQREQFEARLQQQDAKIQRVKDRIELTNPAPRIAASDR